MDASDLIKALPKSLARRGPSTYGTEVLRVLAPLGMDAALKVLDAQTSETSATERQLELALDRRVMRWLTPVGNTTPSILPIASWLASWSGAGTKRLRRYTAPKATLLSWLRENDRHSARPSASS